MSEWYMNPSEGIQSSHVQGITVEALATALAAPVVQRAMADPVPTPAAPVRESEPAEPVPAGTPTVQQPTPVKVKKEDPEPGSSSVIGHAIVLKRPARSARSEPGSIKEEEEDKPPGPPPKKMKPTWEPADDDEDDDDVIFIE